MADYNTIYSSVPSASINGTEGADKILVYGNHSTVQALGGNDIISVEGGRHDNGIWIGDEDNFVDAGEGNDSVEVYSRGVSVYGGAGNDTIKTRRSYGYANGGDGNDILYFTDQLVDNSVLNVTLTGGAGNDTFAVTPYYGGASLSAVVTDFTSNDVLRVDDDEERTLTYSVQNGNVVIKDNKKKYWYGGDTADMDAKPQFEITLQGVGSINEVADAKYYHYNSAGKVPDQYTTLGELFGVSASTPSETVTTPTTTTLAPTTSAPSTTTTLATTTQTSTTTTPTTTEPSTGGNTIINNYYGDVYNVTGNTGTIIVGSSIEGGVGNIYNYNGGDKVIDNYQQGEVVELTSDYRGFDFNENSFFINSSSGQLEIKDARDKFIGYSAYQSEVAVYSYLGGRAGAIDGRDKSQAEIMIGADNADNQIYAGSGGSSLWGGNGGSDNLIGGAGYDEFFYAMGSGNDVIQNAGSNDMINLLGISLSQITSFSYDYESVSLQFNDGGTLRVQGTSEVGYMVENTTYTFNHNTRQWSTK